MKTLASPLLHFTAALAFALTAVAEEKEPVVVTPGVNGAPPSDAIVLFDGKDLSAWKSEAGGVPNWKLENGYAEVQGGGILTKEEFGPIQLHVEWAAPVEVKGDGQGRGNSGVYFQGRYEIQVLDSYQNKTYFNGQAGSFYGHNAPLVNASRKPGEWQSYDIVFHRPLFDQAGKVTRRATFTVLHNGVLTQDHTVLSGGTGWMGPHSASDYQAHPDKLPIAFQDHGNPVRFRNVWIRELKD